jgi:hypothetical protein
MPIFERSLQVRTKRFWHCVYFGIVLACQTVGADEPAKQPKESTADKSTSSWMKLKLDYSQKILAGIAKADFDQIVQSAEAMRNLTTVEGFVRGRVPGYSTQLEIFKDANMELIKQAKRDNVEGATLAFTQITLSCVNCHKKLREESKTSTK